MKNFFPFLLLIISIHSNSQVLCGTTTEGGSITLTAPPGNVFVSIQFASYGTPNGSCGSFTIGACHASNSVSICGTALIGFNSGTVNASNGVFGDPCGGTFKRLYIQALYSTSLPLTLISFTAKKTDPDKVRLDWISEHEINTSAFVVEKSTDGIAFQPAGSVTAAGSGQHNYHFTDNISGSVPNYFFRLKMADLDGRYQYSNIVRISNNPSNAKCMVYPNPAENYITITSNREQEAFITNITGQSIKKIKLITGSQTLNIAGWNTGVYFIKTENAVLKFSKK